MLVFIDRGLVHRNAMTDMQATRPHLMRTLSSTKSIIDDHYTFKHRTGKDIYIYIRCDRNNRIGNDYWRRFITDQMNEIIIQ